MNLKNYVFVVLAIIGLAACKKNRSDDLGQKSKGEDTKISLSLSIVSSGTKTYAGGDANASVSDVEMNTVDIFIYDKVSPFALTHKKFEDIGNASADFESVDGARRLKNDVELVTKTGEKLIYVGVNLPDTYVNYIKDTQGVASLDGIFYAIELYNKDEMSLNAAGMAMFTKVGKVAVLEKTGSGGIPESNQISFELTRMLAKVSVDGTNAFNVLVSDASSDDNLMPVLGGSIDVSTLSHTLRQTNSMTYLIGNGVIPWIQSNDFFNLGGDFSVIGSGPKYIPENKAESELIKLTFALVKARFVPAVFADDAEYNYVPGADFFTATDPITGSVTYYITQSRGSQGANTFPVSEFRKYTGGYCYYHINLNPENEHKVIRNDYYQVKISSIRGIGKSSPATALERGGVLYNAELLRLHATDILYNTLYSSQPLSVNANIEASISIVPWNVIASEYDLQ